MTLIQILTLHESGQLPADPILLESCAKVLQHASELAFDTWRTTTNPTTAKMLEMEQRRYRKVQRWIRSQNSDNPKPAPAKRVTVQSVALQPAFQ